MPISEVYNMDCMEGMKAFPDKFFDLAIVDPPYGVGDWQTVGDADRYSIKAQSKYGEVDWNDTTPDESYFNELIRVSHNQIIWGANYYNRFSRSGGAIIWDKKCDASRYSDGDIASCSLQKKITIFRHRWHGFAQENMSNKEERIHSCQKPVALYRWCLNNYAKPNDKILDTHLGSQSSRIAAYKLGFDFWGYEIDEDYFKQGCERFNKAIAEPLFDSIKVEQIKINLL